jgi:DNA-binding CsgD family transcriptional regulator
MNVDPQNVFIQIPNYVFCKDIHSVYRYCNSHLAHAAGLSSPVEIIGKTDRDLPWSEFASLYQDGDDEILSGHAKQRIVEPLTQTSGETISIIISKEALLDSNGNKIGIVGNFVEHADKMHYGEYDAGKSNVILPKKQGECLFYIAQGFTAQQIADEMHLSKRTIEYYIDILKMKLHCHTKNDLLKKAWTIDYIRNRLKNIFF